MYNGYMCYNWNGGWTIQVELGRFYDVRCFTSSKPNLLGPNAKVLIYWVLMICHESMINIGHPQLRGAIVKGWILYFRLGDKATIYKMHSKKRHDVNQDSNTIQFNLQMIPII
jgi:ribosomal protein L21